MALTVPETIKENNVKYGKPEVQLTKAAELWSAYLSMDIRAKDICMLMVLLKISRELCGKGDPDNTKDMHGYTMIYDQLNKEEIIPVDDVRSQRP